MGRPEQTILMLTNSEWGQANVILAVIHELILHGDLHLHIGSFQGLRKRVDNLYAKSSGLTTNPSILTYHTMPGFSMSEHLVEDINSHNIAHPPGFWGALQGINFMPQALCSWSGAEYVAVVDRCIKIIEDVKPGLVIAEPLFYPAFDACKKIGRNLVVLSPNTLKGMLVVEQSIWAQLFRYPVIGSGFEYPVTTCGSIILPSPPLSEVDPELERWLQGKETVLVCLGTARRVSPATGRELAGGIRLFLRANERYQVLWKLKVTNSAEVDIQGILAEELKSDKVRIVEWLEAEPSAIVGSGHIVCTVNHGGANSFNDGLSAGVPQVILPCWYDTYDSATRVEHHGIGIQGNRKSAPEACAQEFCGALGTVLVGGKQRPM